ncbi:LysR family transcriptional regulator [Roseateles sp. BYS180W]|uniref:LysR family transcriptional regulator n=1 Tax=Roseateles rivi TaxID=3299028 RepID=A0ABW7FTN4_9BURK
MSITPAKQLLQARLMVTFARVVECRSISAAALSLGVDKASVSRQLAELEDMLGVRLLHRSTRKLSLTDIGATVFDRALRVVEELAAAHAEAEHARGTPSGVLSVSTPVAFGTHHLLPYVGEFHRRCPQVTLELCLLDRQVDLQDEGFELLLRLCDHPPETLVASKLADIHYALVATPAFLSSQRPIEQVADLAEVNCLFYGYRKHTAQWRFSAAGAMQAVQVRSRVAVNNSDAVKALALQSLGLALLPLFAIADELQDGRLQRVLPELQAQGYLGRHLFAIYSPTRQPSPKLRSFLSFLREVWLPQQRWLNLDAAVVR